MLILSQIVGVVAVALYLVSFQLKKRVQIVWTTCPSNALYVLQYLLLGAFTGAVMDLCVTVASFLAGKKHAPLFKRYTKWLIAGCTVMILAAGLTLTIVRRQPLELLSIAGALFQMASLWFEDEQTIRKLGLCSAPCWLIYNTVFQAYAASLGSVLAICSGVIALVRYRKKEEIT